MKKRKAAVRVIFFYLLLTAGLWMFLYSYTNFCNRLSAEKIAPAGLVVSTDTAELHLLDRSVSLDLRELSPGRELIFAAYILAPDELRGGVLLLERYQALLL